MRNSQNFWDKNAGRYDRFMRKDAAAFGFGVAVPVPLISSLLFVAGRALLSVQSV